MIKLINFARRSKYFFNRWRNIINIYLTTRKIFKNYKRQHPNEYIFSRSDIWLYLREKLATFLRPQILEENDPISQVSIGPYTVFCPNDVISDLPWLYHEVCDDWKYNPSSYFHPEILDLQPFDWIMDGGACEGLFSLHAKEICNGKIIALEPLPIWKPILQKTFSANRHDKCDIIVETSGLSNSKQYAKIIINEDHLCSSSILDVSQDDNLFNKITIKLETIDFIATKYNLEGDGFIKMDIEGYEMKALLGGERVIKKHKPKLAIAVYHEYENANKCAEIIKSFRSDYIIEYRGMYGYEVPPRPYFLFAY